MRPEPSSGTPAASGKCRASCFEATSASIDPSGDEGRRGVQHLGCVVAEGLLAECGVPLFLERLHRKEDARVQPWRGIVRESQVDGDLVGRLETDPLDFPRDPVGLGGQDTTLAPCRAVLLDQFDALARAYPVSLKEDVELPLGALAVPGLLDRRGPLAPYAGNVAQLGGFLAQDPKRVGAEGIDDLVRVDPADPRDEPASEVFSDSIDACGKLALE